MFFVRYDLKLSVVPVLAEDLESLEEEVFHLELSPKVKCPKLMASSSDASMQDLPGDSYVPGNRKTFIFTPANRSLLLTCKEQIVVASPSVLLQDCPLPHPIR